MDNLKRAKRWGVWGAVLIFVAFVLGILGGYEAMEFNESVAKILDFISKILALLGTIALIVSLYFYSKALKRPEIFKNFLLGIILQIVAELVFLAGFFKGITPAGFRFSSISVSLMFFSYVLWILTSYFFKRSLSALGEALNYKLFKLAGNLIFWGGILSIVGVGFLLLLVGWVLALVGFLKSPVEGKQESS